MLDNPLPCSQTLTKLASERRVVSSVPFWKEPASQVFSSYKPSIVFCFFNHCPLSEGTNRFESKFFTPLIKTPKQGDNVRRFLHALDTYTEKKSIIIMLTTRQMKHKVNLCKNIIISKKKAPIQQTAVSLLTPPPAPPPTRHHELTQ